MGRTVRTLITRARCPVERVGRLHGKRRLHRAVDRNQRFHRSNSSLDHGAPWDPPGRACHSDAQVGTFGPAPGSAGPAFTEAMETGEGDNRAFTIRPIEARDQAALVELLCRPSDDSREARFHGAVRGIGQGQANTFCHPDHEHREGVIASPFPAGRTVMIGHVCLDRGSWGDRDGHCRRRPLAPTGRWPRDALRRSPGRRSRDGPAGRHGPLWQRRGDRVRAFLGCRSRSARRPTTGIELRIELRPAALPAA